MIVLVESVCLYFVWVFYGGFGFIVWVVCCVFRVYCLSLVFGVGWFADWLLYWLFVEEFCKFLVGYFGY